MRSVVIPLLIGLSESFRSRVEMRAEIAALHSVADTAAPYRSTAPTALDRSNLMDVALAAVVSMATRLGDRQTGDCASLASPRLPALLAMEEPQARTGEAKGLA